MFLCFHFHIAVFSSSCLDACVCLSKVLCVLLLLLYFSVFACFCFHFHFAVFLIQLFGCLYLSCFSNRAKFLCVLLLIVSFSVFACFLYFHLALLYHYLAVCLSVCQSSCFPNGSQLSYVPILFIRNLFKFPRCFYCIVISLSMFVLLHVFLMGHNSPAHFSPLPSAIGHSSVVSFPAMPHIHTGRGNGRIRP